MYLKATTMLCIVSLNLKTDLEASSGTRDGSLTPEMMSSTSFDRIDSPETSTYWQKTVSDQESIQDHLAYYHDNNIVTGTSINDLVNNRKSRADKVATNIVSGFGDKTINVSGSLQLAH